MVLQIVLFNSLLMYFYSLLFILGSCVVLHNISLSVLGHPIHLEGVLTINYCIFWPILNIQMRYLWCFLLLKTTLMKNYVNENLYTSVFGVIYHIIILYQTILLAVYIHRLYLVLMILIVLEYLNKRYCFIFTLSRLN